MDICSLKARYHTEFNDYAISKQLCFAESKKLKQLKQLFVTLAHEAIRTRGESDDVTPQSCTLVIREMNFAFW